QLRLWPLRLNEYIRRCPRWRLSRMDCEPGLLGKGSVGTHCMRTFPELLRPFKQGTCPLRTCPCGHEQGSSQLGSTARSLKEANWPPSTSLTTKEPYVTSDSSTPQD